MPESRIVRTTFVAEAVRAVAAGIQETALATFAILIAVRHFGMGPAPKAVLVGCMAIGLLAGLFVVPLVARLRLRTSQAAGGIQLLSMLGFLLAAGSLQSEWLYLVGMSLGMGVIAMAIPLQTHYLRENFPEHQRGRLFSLSILVRALSAILFSWLIAAYLDREMTDFPHVILLFAGSSALAAVSQFFIPSTQLDAAVRKPPVAQSIVWLRRDAVFGRVIAAAMAMGLGVLIANAMRVDYLANPDYAWQLDAKTVALITGVIPSVTRLASTFFWGWLFDRMDFFRLRAIINAVFFAGILLYFLPSQIVMIAVGSALFGLARGGGEILWNLWVTKLAAPANIASYMSVHTFMTGIRMALAPFIGFYIAQAMDLSAVVAVSSFFVILSFVILWPLLVKKG